jgi:hypothetical protein
MLTTVVLLDVANRQKSAKQAEQDTRVECKNSGKNSSLTHSIKQMINVAKSVVVSTSGSARQRNSVTSKSVDAGQSVPVNFFTDIRYKFI